MPAAELICPACSSRLKRPAALRDGEMFECPMCAEKFRVGETRIAQQPTRRAEATEEVVDDLEIVGDDRRAGRRRPRRRREIELGRWIRLGFVHWMPMLPPSIGFAILYVICYLTAALAVGFLARLLAHAHPVLGMGLGAFCFLSIMVPLSAGMTLVSIQQVQGKRWSFGDFFAGSQWWLPLLLNFVLLEILYFLVIGVPSILISVVFSALHLPPLIAQLVVTLFQILATLCLYPLTWMFSWQLILDGNYGPMEAILENMRMALPDLLRLLPLTIVTLLIRCLGVALCGVGFAAAWPLAVLIETAAYLRLTGRRVAESPSEINTGVGP
jgi:hypothetical protein